MTKEPEDSAAAAGPYRVLARKYRPSSFDDLIGQAPMVRTLTNAFDAGRIAQAWMLTGVRGVGKTTTARILARALNYETPSIHQPSIVMREAGVHDRAIMEGRHVDVVEMDAASHTGIDDIREIIAQVRYRPVSARYKVYIIDEVHMLSTQAFNGLLKTLEEPPEHVKFVFATTEIRKVPITVLSRCQRFDLRRVDAAEMIEHLRCILLAEKVEVEDEALRILARASEGSVRDALSLTDQAIAHGAGSITAAAVRDMLGLADRVRIIDLFEHLMRGDGSAALAEFADQYASGADPVVVLTDLADFTHLVTTLRYVPEAAGDASLSPSEVERGQRFAGSLSVRTLGQVWQMLLKAIEEARLAAAPRQAAEMALIRIAHAADLPDPGELLRMLERGEVPALSPASLPSAPASTLASAAPAGSSPSPAAPRSDDRSPPSPRGGPSLAAMMRESTPAPAPVAAPAPEALADLPNSLEDLVALARGDARMRTWIRRYLRLRSMQAGQIEVELAPGAPASLANELSRKLFEWTGRRSVVSVVMEGGAPTLEEQETERRQRLVEEAKADPEVAAILAAVPGAVVREVRLRGEDANAADLDDLPLARDEVLGDIDLDPWDEAGDDPASGSEPDEIVDAGFDETEDDGQ